MTSADFTEKLPVQRVGDGNGHRVERNLAATLTTTDTSPEVREFYNDYAAPRYVTKTVRTLLKSVPERYLSGLDCIVLINQSGLPRRDRLGKTTSRKRRITQSLILGRYHPAWSGQPPWIELFVDKIVRELKEQRFGWLPLMKEAGFGLVLFHEIGHHIHATARPEFREKEDVADDWGDILFKNFVRRKYWYLAIVGKPIAVLRRMIKRQQRLR